MSQQVAVENDEKHTDLCEWAHGIQHLMTNERRASKHQMSKIYINIYGSALEMMYEMIWTVQQSEMV